MSEDLRTVERSVTLPVPREELWDLLTRPEQLSAWFGAEVEELDLRPGGRIAFRGPDGRIRRALIQELEPLTRLAFRWLPSGGEAVDEHPSTVEFLLEEVAEGTRLTIVESRHSTDADPVAPEMESGWAPILADPPPDPPGAPPRILLHT
jgi:uncharacterized protein YndB with AHSA1/START domain